MNNSDSLKRYMLKDSYNQKYSWPLVDFKLIDGITKFLGNMSCLSVMSGKGVLEYNLLIKCVEIIATDILPTHEKTKELYDSNTFSVKMMDALTAVRTIDRKSTIDFMASIHGLFYRKGIANGSFV